MWRILFVALLVLPGCMWGNREITEYIYSQQPMKQHRTSTWHKQYERKVLDGVHFAGTVKIGNIEVSYLKGFESQANCIADQLRKSLRYIHESTGFTMAFERIKVYLLQVDQAWLQYTKGTDRIRPHFILSGDDLDMVLIVEATSDSCGLMIANNHEYPWVFMHELVESSLLYPKTGPPIPGDYRWDKGFWALKKVLNYTRWFREGFATYAAYLAYEAIIPSIDFDETRVAMTTIQNTMDRHPFLALSKVGKDLFTWSQFDFYNNPTATRSMEYYDAAFGLFLVIRDRFGDEAIRKIILGIGRLEWVDGPALIKLANETLNTDITQLAEGFNFPETGLSMDPLFPTEGAQKGLSIKEGLFVTSVAPNSPAQRAGIQKGDVIRSINDSSTTTELNFELALYKFMEQPSVRIGLWRKEIGKMTVEMELANQAIH